MHGRVPCILSKFAPILPEFFYLIEYFMAKRRRGLPPRCNLPATVKKVDDFFNIAFYHFSLRYFDFYDIIK